MWALIPTPYRILGAVLLALALFASGFGYGVSITRDHAAAQQLVAQIKAAEQYQAEVKRGNAISANLAEAETLIHDLTLKRNRYVHQVTQDKPCLSGAAVDLANGVLPTADDTGAATGQPHPESPPALAASDTDVENWIIAAHDLYDTCALRLGKLIDYEAQP